MTKRFLTIGVLFVLLSSASAFATVYSQTQTFSGIPNMNNSFTFNQFDDHGGTWVLESIQITLTVNSDGGIFVLDNDSTSAASGTFEFGAKGSLTSSDVILLSSLFAAIPGDVGAYQSQSFSLGADNGDGVGNIDSTGTDGLTYTGTSESNTKTGTVSNALWTAGTTGFIGTGTYDIFANILQWSNYGSLGGIEYSVTPVSVSGSVQVSYIYNVIPEPATMVILALGGLVSMKKGFKKA